MFFLLNLGCILCLRHPNDVSFFILLCCLAQYLAALHSNNTNISPPFFLFFPWMYIVYIEQNVPFVTAWLYMYLVFGNTKHKKKACHLQ